MIYAHNVNQEYLLVNAILINDLILLPDAVIGELAAASLTPVSAWAFTQLPPSYNSHYWGIKAVY
ncbi:hypothetical protein DBO95_13260 [Yersinia pestis]|nr:hypothetical protein DBO95_13260 [Yersinia pestis]